MNKSLFPKLRFPEFQDEWKNESLGNVYSFKVTNSFSRDQLNYENGSVKNIHYGDIHTKFSTLFDIKKEKVPFINPLVSLEKIARESYCIEGDIVFADASEDLEDVGKSIEIVNVNNEKLLSGMHTLLARQKEKKIIVGFGGYLFKSDSIRLQIKKEAQGAKVLGISANRLLNIDICYPLNKSEQQKIADCLTSLDDLIAAQSQKVETLQAYRKGLMQNLFPAEGESVPRLRFPEFESAGEWEFVPLGEVGEIVTGKTPSTSDNTLWNGEIQFVTPTDIKDDEKYQYRTQRTVSLTEKIKVLPKHSIMFTCIASIGKMAISVFPCITNQQINTIIPSNNFENEYVYYALLSITDYIKSTQANAVLPIINKTEFSKFLIPVPSMPEQQRIAELLSALDEEISAQGEAVAALKVHKKGLMQGLFPSMDEVQG